jgi:DNA-binding response OmpR family regulator
MDVVKKKKILLIDDDMQIRELLRRCVERWGYEFASAQDGKEGIDKVKEFQPNLILLDIMMPEMDGFSVQDHLKNDPETANIPIIFTTAKNTIEDTITAMSQGAVGYVEKPFDMDRLLRKIKALLDPPAK